MTGGGSTGREPNSDTAGFALPPLSYSTEGLIEEQPLVMLLSAAPANKMLSFNTDVELFNNSENGESFSG